MTDKFGVPLSIGDRVIYTTGGQGCTYLETGTIIEFVTGRFDQARIKSDESGRILTNGRGQHSLVALSPIQAQYPELFI